MNISIEGKPPHLDITDVVILLMVVFIIVSTWTWVYIHPSVEAYVAAIGGTGTFGAIFHGLRVLDDKKPDAS